MMTPLVIAILVGAGLGYLGLLCLAAYLWWTVAGYRADLTSLREQNERYADAIARTYPTPPPARHPGVHTAPDELQPKSTYFTRRSGWKS